jgi:uncharacterized protein YndB with AHSA1/START domain
VIRGGRIVQQVVFPTDRETLFGYFTDAGRLSSWLADQVEFDAVPGSAYRLGLPGGQYWEGVVVELEVPSRLVLTLGWRDASLGLPPGMSLVSWDFSLDANGTRLRMSHEHVPGELLLLHNDVWARVFARLRHLLEGRPLGPHPLEDLPQRREQLEAEGGLT